MFRDDIDCARARTSSMKSDFNTKRGDALALLKKVSIKMEKKSGLGGSPWGTPALVKILGADTFPFVLRDNELPSRH